MTGKGTVVVTTPGVTLEHFSVRPLSWWVQMELCTCDTAEYLHFSVTFEDECLASTVGERQGVRVGGWGGRGGVVLERSYWYQTNRFWMERTTRTD